MMDAPTCEVRRPVQLDLLSEVLHSYSAERNGRVSNGVLYEQVASRAGIDPSEFSKKTPVGDAQQPHSLLARKVRWHQQTLKHAGILERIDGERGVWQLTQPAGKDLNRIGPNVAVVGFSTDLGVAILGACETVFSAIDSPITLCLTSPPYPLAKARNYGNPSEAAYVDWVCQQLEPIVKNLVRGGSIALNISNDVFLPGMPARSLYRERLILALHDRLGLFKMDEFPWHNPSKPPGPVRYASIDRTQLNVSWEPVYWLTNDPRAVRSDNRRVLREHTERHLRLMQNGGEQRDQVFSDGAYRVHPGRFGNQTDGKIPRNLLTYGHSCSDQRAYKRAARAAGLPAHGAPMPLALASFLIEFLSEPGDLIVDPFGGSFTTAKAAERLGRRWLSSECMLEYVLGGATRFYDALGFRQNLLLAA
ncbi:MAG: DNA methylase N-4/N-6 domain protein [Rhodocyclaceae bacterium]|nr:MAG: DNA methylase N-4/N-6 domain protein [Rhodocyclaceae bacterium]